MSLQDFKTTKSSDNSQSRESKANTRECPSCGSEYKMIGNHWGNTCSYPKMNKHQLDIVKGSILGDGTLRQSKLSSYPQLSIGMRNKKYLEHIQDIFNPLTAGVNRNTNCFQIATTPHPSLNDLKWDVGPKTNIPKGIDVNPTILKHWFVQDGGLDWANQDASIQICSGTFDLDRIATILQGIGIDGTPLTNRVRVSQHDTEKFFNYIGKPVQGFEHKWEYESKDKYNRLKNEVSYQW